MKQEHSESISTLRTPRSLSVPHGPVVPQGINRCRQRTRSGSRCRLHVLDSATGRCFRHTARPGAPIEDTDLSAHFSGKLDDLTSAVQINDFLATLAGLVVRNQISARRAAVLAYITNQLLHTLPAIEHELDPHGDNQIPAFEFERPQSALIDDPGQPS